MPVNWSKASPERIHKRNVKRRQRYANLDPNVKKEILSKDTKRIQETREASGITIEKRWALKLKKLSEWDGRGPLPTRLWIMHATTEFLKVKKLYGNLCTTPGCGGRSLDYFWHFAPKSDPIRWLPHRQAAYQRILRYPEEYDMVCSSCAYHRNILAVAWVFQDNPPLLKPDASETTAYTYNLTVNAYPRDKRALLDKIKAGVVKGFMGFQSRVKWKQLPAFLRENYLSALDSPGFIRVNPLYKNIRNGYRRMMYEEQWFKQPGTTPSTRINNDEQYAPVVW
jgi:hypothetical protein